MKLLGAFAVVLFCLSGQISRAEPVEVTVKLSPVGSYVAKTSSLDGSATLVGGKVKATNVKVLVKTLKTGIELRDKHTIERLQADKFPEIFLVSGEGENGKGKGIVKIKGIEKPVEGTYSVEGSAVKATFKLSLKDFGIEKIKYLGIGVKDEVEVKVQIPVKK